MNALIPERVHLFSSLEISRRRGLLGVLILFETRCVFHCQRSGEIAFSSQGEQRIPRRYASRNDK